MKISNAKSRSVFDAKSSSELLLGSQMKSSTETQYKKPDQCSAALLVGRGTCVGEDRSFRRLADSDCFQRSIALLRLCAEALTGTLHSALAKQRQSQRARERIQERVQERVKERERVRERATEQESERASERASRERTASESGRKRHACIRLAERRTDL